LDANLQRIFKLTERFSLEARLESENIGNTPHFYDPTNSCSDTVVNGAHVCGGTFGQLNNGSYGQRILQFALYLRF
jgi:hypothetical protein